MTASVATPSTDTAPPPYSRQSTHTPLFSCVPSAASSSRALMVRVDAKVTSPFATALGSPMRILRGDRALALVGDLTRRAERLLHMGDEMRFHLGRVHLVAAELAHRRDG